MGRSDPPHGAQQDPEHPGHGATDPVHAFARRLGAGQRQHRGHAPVELLGEGSGQQVVKAALRVAGYDAGDHVGQVGLRLNPIQLARLDERGDDHPAHDPPLDPASRAVFSVRPSGRMAHLTALLSISTPPSSKNRLKPTQRASVQRIASLLTFPRSLRLGSPSDPAAVPTSRRASRCERGRRSGQRRKRP